MNTPNLKSHFKPISVLSCHPALHLGLFQGEAENWSVTQVYPSDIQYPHLPVAPINADPLWVNKCPELNFTINCKGGEYAKLMDAITREFTTKLGVPKSLMVSTPTYREDSWPRKSYIEGARRHPTFFEAVEMISKSGSSTCSMCGMPFKYTTHNQTISCKCGSMQWHEPVPVTTAVEVVDLVPEVPKKPKKVLGQIFLPYNILDMCRTNRMLNADERGKVVDALQQHAVTQLGLKDPNEQHRGKPIGIRNRPMDMFCVTMNGNGEAEKDYLNPDSPFYVIGSHSLCDDPPRSVLAHCIGLTEAEFKRWYQNTTPDNLADDDLRLIRMKVENFRLKADLKVVQSDLDDANNQIAEDSTNENALSEKLYKSQQAYDLLSKDCQQLSQNVVTLEQEKGQIRHDYESLKNNYDDLMKQVEGVPALRDELKEQDRKVLELRGNLCAIKDDFYNLKERHAAVTDPAVAAYLIFRKWTNGNRPMVDALKPFDLNSESHGWKTIAEHVRNNWNSTDKQDAGKSCGRLAFEMYNRIYNSLCVGWSGVCNESKKHWEEIGQACLTPRKCIYLDEIPTGHEYFLLPVDNHCGPRTIHIDSLIRQGYALHVAE